VSWRSCEQTLDKGSGVRGREKRRILTTDGTDGTDWEEMLAGFS
jgi:hypothetical protein